MQKISKLIFFLSALTALTSVSLAKEIDRIVAIVNNDIIMQSELNQALKKHKTQKQSLPKAANYRASVLEQLINDRLREQIVKNIGVEVTPGMIDDAVAQIASQNNLSIEQLEQALPSQGLNMQSLRSKIKKEIEATIFQQQVLKGKNAISEAELKKETNKQPKSVILGNSPKYYHVAHILIAVNDPEDVAEVKNKLAKAQNLLNKINSGFDFAAAAEENSNSPTAEDGGDLGWRLLDDYPKLIADVIEKMQSGAVKGPIKDNNGFHLIKLVETEGGIIRKNFSPEERKQQARNVLLQKKAEKHIEKILRRYRDEAYIELRL